MDGTEFLAVHPDPVVHYAARDGGAGVRRVNPAFERTFGADAATVTLSDTIASGDDRATVASAIRDGEPLDLDAVCETADGPRTFRLRNVPLEDEDEDGGYLVYTDVGDRAETVADLRERNDRLEAFASVVSHDLRNPIGVARTYLEEGREQGEPAHFERVATALDRMERLVGDVLELAREGKTIGEPVRVALADVAVDAWERVEGDGRLAVRDETATLRADPDRLRQVLENLFQNSVEHAGPRVSITVGALTDGTGFFVEDDGPGIPADEREEVFEPGVTGAGEGVGLGLAIVERIADAHGWTVRVTEGRKGGARFEVTGVDSFQPF